MSAPDPSPAKHPPSAADLGYIVKSLGYVFLYFIIATPILIFLISFLNGPMNYGVRCSRDLSQAKCEILQTRFFGIFDNVAFTVPEEDLRDAEGVCRAGGMGRGRSVSCNLYLTFNTGQEDYPAISYEFLRSSLMKSDAKRLNNYLIDKTVPNIEITNGGVLDLLEYLTAIFAVCLVLCGVVWLFLRKKRMT